MQTNVTPCGTLVTSRLNGREVGQVGQWEMGIVLFPFRKRTTGQVERKVLWSVENLMLLNVNGVVSISVSVRVS